MQLKWLEGLIIEFMDWPTIENKCKVMIMVLGNAASPSHMSGQQLDSMQVKGAVGVQIDGL